PTAPQSARARSRAVRARVERARSAGRPPGARAIRARVPRRRSPRTGPTRAESTRALRANRSSPLRFARAAALAHERLELVEAGLARELGQVDEGRDHRARIAARNRIEQRGERPRHPLRARRQRTVFVGAAALAPRDQTLAHEALQRRLNRVAR